MVDVFTFSVDQLVSEPTRIAGPSCSVLDLMFVSSLLQNNTLNVENGISDHKMIVFSCPILGNRERVKPSIAVIKDYSRADDNVISEYLNARFLQFSLLHDVNELWFRFKHIVQFCEGHVNISCSFRLDERDCARQLF